MRAVVPQDTELVEVRLLGFPVEIQAAAEEHNQELLREFSHIAHSNAETTQHIPGRLVALVERLRAQYGQFTEPGRDQIDRARRAGRTSVDVVYHVPPSMSLAVGEFSAQLDEADEFCRKGHLLTLATPEEQVAFRRWFLSEFERQIAGAAPLPWPAYKMGSSDG